MSNTSEYIAVRRVDELSWPDFRPKAKDIDAHPPVEQVQPCLGRCFVQYIEVQYTEHSGSLPQWIYG